VTQHKCQILICIFGFLFWSTTEPADASALRVAPVSIELSEPARTATVRIRNEGKTPVTVQMRVFEWTQNNGEDRLSKTRDVVISPPITELLPKREYVIRIIRISKRPVKEEENYRLLIDELPGKPSRGKASVSLLIRKSLPIRIAGAEIAPGQLEWAVLKKRGKTELTAKNTSGQRIKISGLKVLSADDRQLLHLKGLSGYVLGGSFKRWILPSNAGKLGLGQTIRISGKTDTGRINSHASVQAGN
jgi:fimbrial chaperone protein